MNSILPLFHPFLIPIIFFFMLLKAIFVCVGCVSATGGRWGVTATLIQSLVRPINCNSYRLCELHTHDKLLSTHNILLCDILHDVPFI